MNKRINTLLDFLKEIEKYKLIEREVYCSDLKRRESDAEHSWHLAMFIFLFQKDLPRNLDFNKMLKLALMHDLVEIYAGDTFTFDKINQKTKKTKELAAAKKLFAKLPPDLSREFMELFTEYEDLSTKEAKVVKSFDKIQPILQNLCSEGKSWKEHRIKYKDIDEIKRKYVIHDKVILKIYEKLMNEAKRKKLI
jgi:putative hydrolase of HD superfamily